MHSPSTSQVDPQPEVAAGLTNTLNTIIENNRCSLKGKERAMESDMEEKE
jgi:hypothetical protein